MSRILCLSDSPLSSTGYSSQSRELMNHLAGKGWDVTYCGHNYHGHTLKNVQFEDKQKLNFRLITGSARTRYSADLIQPYIQHYKPKIFFTLLDTFMTYEAGFQNLDFAPAKSIFWFPSDGGWFPSNCEQILKKYDYPVAMAKFGQEQIERLYGIKCRHIPHAVDTSHYYPYSKEKRLKLRTQKRLHDKFVVGCVSRNQPRKMLDRQIRIFAGFAHDKPDVIMLMHADPTDAATVNNLNILIHRFGIQNKVMWSGMRYYSGFTLDQMRDIYNCMDVHLLSTSGEGFGVPTIEAAACNVPSVITDYTTTKELVTDHSAGLGIKLVGTEKRPYPAEYDAKNIIDGTWTGSWEVDRGICSIKDGIKQLERCYNDRALVKEMGENGRRAAVKYYDANTVVFPAWRQLFKEILK